MVVAVSGSDVSPIVRIPGNSGTLIKRALDTGAHGIVVPSINTASEARSVVRLAKFPPLEYVARANGTLITMIQVETKAGVEYVDEISQVEGVDLLFIGPNDLSLDILGYTPAKFTETAFLEAIDKVVETAHKHGKKVGILVVDGEAAKKAKERFDMVLVSNDVRSLQAWYGNELEIARS
ncbi:hypothetical protein PV05_07325 [Exophiala xenobiotica]|uniref:HpcH/HpaI aldolase/citrate lyase domain-containing protein n=1 Tax=Exophiala xenobiotica TaxID=348802 RepID=A0A0D2CY07_9EURO|nr:uncharacterized protein PV05_07325 [Exophiala xenobiotica]KIW55007.1 hypothetical protein PV05_07325 [Exophiala xenobiotica]